jgi:hypothetical protein
MFSSSLPIIRFLIGSGSRACAQRGFTQAGICPRIIRSGKARRTDGGLSGRYRWMRAPELPYLSGFAGPDGSRRKTGINGRALQPHACLVNGVFLVHRRPSACGESLPAGMESRQRADRTPSGDKPELHTGFTHMARGMDAVGALSFRQAGSVICPP